MCYITSIIKFLELNIFQINIIKIGLWAKQGLSVELS